MPHVLTEDIGVGVHSGKEPFRIVVTGGPCSGKTSLWRFLGAHFPESVMVPETATDMILSGATPWGLGVESFQCMLFRRQLRAEDAALEKGTFLICDRGAADGLAYFPELFSCLHISLKDILDRYALILHLEVIRDPALFACFARGNPARTENHPEALALDERIRDVYAAHRGYARLTGNLERKKEKALRILRMRIA